MKDKDNKDIVKGSIIDLHQTVNGENIFIVISVEPLDVRYGYDLNRLYEYSLNELFNPCKYSNETEFEIVGNIYDAINCRNK